MWGKAFRGNGQGRSQRAEAQLGRGVGTQARAPGPLAALLPLKVLPLPHTHYTQPAPQPPSCLLRCAAVPPPPLTRASSCNLFNGSYDPEGYADLLCEHFAELGHAEDATRAARRWAWLPRGWA